MLPHLERSHDFIALLALRAQPHHGVAAGEAGPRFHLRAEDRAERSSLRKSPRFNEAHRGFRQLFNMLLADSFCGGLRIAETPDSVVR